MYTSEERVVRDGVLVAFDGEVMTDEEAGRRGLLPGMVESPEPEARPKRRKHDGPSGDAAGETEGA